MLALGLGVGRINELDVWFDETAFLRPLETAYSLFRKKQARNHCSEPPPIVRFYGSL
jgi:hypothetical protein